jgi:tetratricopeptide (TPR) repeat protein
VVAIGVAVTALLLPKTCLEGQANLADSQSKLAKELATIPQVIAQSLAASNPPTISPIRPATLPITKRPTIRLTLTPIDVRSEVLEDEMALLVDSLGAQYPNNAEAKHVAALMKAQTRKFEEAQSLWSECIRLAPDKELYYVNVASIAMEQGKDALALEVLMKGIDRGFGSLDIVHHLGLALIKLGKHEETLQRMESDLKKFPNAIPLLLLFGQAQLELGQFAQSEASFRKAMDLGADTPSLYVGLGNACIRQGLRDEGSRYLKIYADRIAKDHLSGHERYQALNTKEIKQTAISVFTEAAAFCYRQNNALQTERLLMRCVAIAPNSLSGLRALADLYFKQQMLPEERVVRERILEIGTDRFSDFLDLAKVCAQLNDAESAEATLKLATAHHPQSIEPFAALSQLYLQANRLEHAKWYAQQSIERQPTADGFRFLASICKLQKDALGESEAMRHAKLLEAKP